MNGKRVFRLVQLVATGGIVFQLVGCAGGLAPVLLSIAESSILDLLFTSLVPGL